MSNQSELDEILGHWIKGYINGSASKFYVTNQTKQDILDWHNKQVAGIITANQFLNHIADGMPYDESFTFSELESALEAIEAERNKLKESSNE